MHSALQAIQGTASYLKALNAGERVSDAAGRLISNGSRMQALLDDLSDFNQSRLGLEINVIRTSVNLGMRSLKKWKSCAPFILTGRLICW